MENMEEVNTDLANLNITDEEEDPMVVLGDDSADAHLYDLCLVGRVLTDSVVNFPSLRNTLADLWHPLKGVSITVLEDKRILFRFYCEIDLNRVLEGIPWFFNRYLIIFSRLMEGDDPNTVPLWETAFWIQIHSLPSGFMSDRTARQFGDFIGKFMEYDTNLVTRGVSKFMCIRVLIDVRLLLKRRKWINIGQNRFIYALFQYERLSLFCFLCGRLGHGENFCEICLTLENQQVEFGWDLSLRAVPRRGGQSVSKWLREKTDSEGKSGMEIDGDRRRVFGADITNSRVYPGGAASMNCISRQIRFSKFHIDVEVVNDVEMVHWRLTGFYGAPVENDRRNSWELLRLLKRGNIKPLMIVRNFNEILYSFEKKRGRIREERQMAAFREVLDACEIHDLGLIGQWYTWERGRLVENIIRERLDRGVANPEWWGFFSEYKVSHLQHSFSDHCPVLVDTIGE
ncbi:hypothetical protein J1N35_012502 [Gossypium stocksii]|uniref:DUF4283 domain-containing protein n=1 Tax=Gossypium stocksii TaxID=47602 RepID=A0A9D4AEB1_9ROSI|nr:hypothetical protein J1N35_012502 [Gossypium stocksii]